VFCNFSNDLPKNSVVEFHTELITQLYVLLTSDHKRFCHLCSVKFENSCQNKGTWATG